MLPYYFNIIVEVFCLRFYSKNNIYIESLLWTNDLAGINIINFITINSSGYGVEILVLFWELTVNFIN